MSVSPLPHRPSTFGEYDLGTVVGSDLTSTTYRAVPIDRTHGGAVALRVVDDHVAAHARAGKGFLHVNQRIADVDHPHLLRVVDLGTHQQTPYTASAWRDGTPLGDLLLETGPLPIGDALRLCGQVAEALDVAHAKGIVHGTVGLTSVWIRRRPGSRMQPSAAVTAFGTSHLLAPVIHEVEQDEVVPELLFLAPEQLRGEPAGPAADQYALACTLYTMVTGTTPFRGDTHNDLFGAHLYGDVPTASDVRPSLGGGWDDVFARALAKDPAERYDNCRTMLLAAGRRSAHRAVAARPAPSDAAHRPVPVHTADLDDDEPTSRRWMLVMLITLLVAAAGTLAAAQLGLLTGG